MDMAPRLALLFLLAFGAVRAEALQDCLDRHAEAALDQAIPLAECPGLLALPDSWRAALVPPLEADTVTPAQLADLRALLPAPPAEPHYSLDYRAIPAVLAQTLQAEERIASAAWWERILAWLKEHLGQEQSTQLDWLENWFARFAPPEDLVQGIFYLSLVLIVALAVLIVINEIRALGLDFKRRHSPALAALGTRAAIQAGPSLAQIRDLPLAGQLPALLALSIRHLAQQGALPDDPSLTNRQYRRHLARHPAEPNFAQLARRAEAVLYGGQTPAPEDCRAGFDEARALLAMTPSPDSHAPNLLATDEHR
jgi:hypothetical protein